jgi:hypothetical protein
MIVNLLEERRLNNGRLSAGRKPPRDRNRWKGEKKGERKKLPRSPVETGDDDGFGKMVADEKRSLER